MSGKLSATTTTSNTNTSTARAFKTPSRHQAIDPQYPVDLDQQPQAHNTNHLHNSDQPHLEVIPATQLPMTNIPVTPASVSLGTLQANHPASLVSGAAELASQLAQVIDQQKLVTVIKGRRFVNVEGWTTLATMLGVTAREITTTENDGIFTATVELVRMTDGACISRASAECGSPDELDKYGKPVWSVRPRYARRSMAQTRATGKACRLAFSWIMSLAGYEVTPAEEMTPIIEAEVVTEHNTAKQRTAQTSQTNPTPVNRSSLSANEPQLPPEPTNTNTRITASQCKLLAAQIRDYQLDINRVEASIRKEWQVLRLADLNPYQFEKLLIQLERWAAQEYAKAEAASALSQDAVVF